MAMNVDLKGKYPSEIAEDDLELMQLWGQINNAWDDIERLLYIAFDAMLSDETSFATQAVFYSQTSHAARRTMVESLAEYALLNRPQTTQKLKNAIKRVKARADDRNKLAHGMWSIGVNLATGEHGPQRMVFSPKLIPDQKDIYSRKRMVEVHKKMRETAKDLREAIKPIEEEKRTKATTLNEKHVKLAIPLEYKS